MEDRNFESVIPREELARQGRSAALYLGCGIFLLVLSVGARFPVLRIALSLAAPLIGALILSRRPADKKPGLVMAAGGALGIFYRFSPAVFKPIAGFVIILGALGLLAAGIWKGIQFLAGSGKRR